MNDHPSFTKAWRFVVSTAPAGACAGGYSGDAHFGGMRFTKRTEAVAFGESERARLLVYVGSEV